MYTEAAQVTWDDAFTVTATRRPFCVTGKTRAALVPPSPVTSDEQTAVTAIRVGTNDTVTDSPAPAQLT